MTAVLTRRPGLARIKARSAGAPLHAFCLAFVALVVLASLFAPWLAPSDPNAVDLSRALAGTTVDHPLGADAAGRDTLSRLLVGARASLLGPLGVVAFSTVLGVAVGMAAAWRGGWLDSVLSRSTELVFAFPGMLLAIIVISVYGEGLLAPVIALAVAYLPYVSRLTRSLVLAERMRPYVSAYQVQGHSPFAICLRHILPNIAPVVLAQATINFGYALMDLAGLSFLGLGVPRSPPTGAAWSSTGRRPSSTDTPCPRWSPASSSC